MKRLFFASFFLLFFLSLAAQTCLEIAIQKGQTAYNQGNYTKARDFWEAGKDCAATNVKKLDGLIWKTKDADGDGVVNGRDKCPDSPGTNANGCPPAKQEPKPDRDGDGVPDVQDKCPDTPGTAALDGCPDPKDSDEDGTPDAQDDCPTKYGPTQYRGCPDRDFDETPDIKDACPDQAGPKNTAGCPDRDADGVADKDDQCPELPGLKSLAGCPDRDGDGIPDKDDKCPDLPGLKIFIGCLDRDNDGVADPTDDCPDSPGPKRFNGCPDRDFDETPDVKDGCPDTPGPKTAYGCPDRDADGVADKDDQCPDLVGSASNNGCPELVPPDMARIPGGTFTMGNLFGDGGETQHSVTVSTFYLGKTEVTFDEFNAFCAATGKEKPRDSGVGRGKHPVSNVDWYDAVEFCNWLSLQENCSPVYTIDKSRQDPNNSDSTDTKKWIVTRDPGADGYRLPTEAEWEYAAREGGKKVRFGNGKDVADPTQINFDASASKKEAYSIVGEFRDKTVETGSLRSPNALGLHDMSGNVMEWCGDWYGAYPSAAQTDPAGATGGGKRVVRGGDYFNGPQSCCAASRANIRPTNRSINVGFRVAFSGQ